jgi:hypothetical protein
VREFGSRGCAARMAQEFGDHPEVAVTRMRWTLLVVDETFAPPGSRPAVPGCSLRPRQRTARPLPEPSPNTPAPATNPDLLHPGAHRPKVAIKGLFGCARTVRTPMVCSPVRLFAVAASFAAPPDAESTGSRCGGADWEQRVALTALTAGSVAELLVSSRPRTS